MRLGGRRFLLGSALVVASACLGLAVSLPFLRLTRPAFFATAHSLISAVDALARSGQLLLAGMILMFGLFLPLLRLLYLLLLALLPLAEINRAAGQLRALDWLGRWSPQDLLGLALAGAVIAGQPALTQRAAAGAYFLAAAVLAMTLAYAWLRAEVSGPRLRTAATRTAQALATRGPVFAVLMGLAAGTFALGLTLPALRLSVPYAGTDTHSLAGIGWALYTRGAMLQALALAALAALLPGLRLIYLLTLVLVRALPSGPRARVIAGAEALGRYAVVDMLALALMLFYLIATGAADPVPQPGAYCLGASALLTLLAYAWTNMAAPAPAAPGTTLAQRLAGLAAEPASKS